MFRRWNFKYNDADLKLIFELILDANYMGIKPLIELSSVKVVSIIKGENT